MHHPDNDNALGSADVAALLYGFTALLNLTREPDLRFKRGGTYTVISAHTKTGRTWIKKHVHYEPWQKRPEGIYAEPRMAADIAGAVQAAGLNWRWR